VRADLRVSIGPNVPQIRYPPLFVTYINYLYPGLLIMRRGVVVFWILCDMYNELFIILQHANVFTDS
jgi:hypothetical protein